MKKRTRILVVAALVPAVVLGVAVPMALASGSSQRGLFDRLSLAAGMKGANEVAPVVGDLDSAGYAVVDVNLFRGQVCVEDFATGGADPFHLFHIHQGGPTENGPVVVDFTPLLPSGIGCVTVPAESRGVLTHIVLNPGGFYVNAHNLPDHPGGALRGQLVRVLG
jgi:CHRD domain